MYSHSTLELEVTTGSSGIIRKDGLHTMNRYFAGYSSDGYTNQYIAFVKRNTSTNDSFYKTNHGFPNNQNVTLSVADGGQIQYFYDQI